MTIIVVLLGGLALALVVAVGVALYVTVSINARANRQDTIVSVPFAADAPEEFMRTLAAAAGQGMLAGNGVEIYQNGCTIFPPMLDAIRNARATVHFATFVYEAGHIPDEFGEAFSDAARRGVEVRVVLDSNGARKIRPGVVDRMRNAGCNVQWFGRPRWYDWEKYNRRMHRKLLVVDGVVAFTGGVGIADQWDGNGDGPRHWRDTHAKVTGPAVAALQAAFVDTWNDATGELLLDDSYFPELSPTGDIQMCVVQSNPASATSAAQRVMAALVAGARHSLAITNAYFVPTPPFNAALTEARKRGVRVRILTPGPFHNKPAVRRASRYTWRTLLVDGVELFEHQQTMVHAKVLIVDDVVLSVGSINFDPRSFALNAECGVVMLDAELAGGAARQFEHDLLSARQTTLADIARRPFLSRAIDGVAYFFRAQL